MTASFSAPGKTILFGEHAVVYGWPALAAPLPQLRAYARIRRLNQPLTVVGSDIPPSVWHLQPRMPDSNDPIIRMVELTRRQLQLPQLKGEITLASDIPVARGLGSGAAVSAALGRAVAATAGAAITDRELNQLVFQVEKLHHGTPSGIDNTVVVFEQPVYFIKDRLPEFVAFASSLRLLLADTGIVALTREAVAQVKRLRQTRPKATGAKLRRIGEIVDEARACIAEGDMAQVGQLLTENHHILRALGVSSGDLDSLAQAALAGGAKGAKLSGGGRGGIIVALVDHVTEARVREMLLRAGAINVIAATVGGDVG